MYYGSLTITMNIKDATRLVNRGKSTKKILSHSTSCPTFSKATNSASIMDLTMQVNFDNFQEISGLYLICIRDTISITISLMQ
jgi:hypothetical protein